VAADTPLDGGTFADRAFRVATDAYAASPASWERSVQSALAELLAFLAGESEQTEGCVALAPGGHPGTLEHREELVERFATLLSPGFETPQPPPPIVAEAIGGAILELVRIHVKERRVDDLPSALPTATLIVLTPFVGPKQAGELATARAEPGPVRASRLGG
jgi:hypothetical protein